MKLVKYIPEDERKRTRTQLVVTVAVVLGGVAVIGIGSYPISQRIDALTVLSLIFVNGFGLLILYSGALLVLSWIANRPPKRR